jgi:hypothetical protein
MKEINEMRTRVARWYFFKPKMPIWANIGESSN